VAAPKIPFSIPPTLAQVRARLSADLRANVRRKVFLRRACTRAPTKGIQRRVSPRHPPSTIPATRIRPHRLGACFGKDRSLLHQGGAREEGKTKSSRPHLLVDASGSMGLSRQRNDQQGSSTHKYLARVDGIPDCCNQRDCCGPGPGARSSGYGRWLAAALDTSKTVAADSRHAGKRQKPRRREPNLAADLGPPPARPKLRAPACTAAHLFPTAFDQVNQTDPRALRPPASSPGHENLALSTSLAPERARVSVSRSATQFFATWKIRPTSFPASSVDLRAGPVRRRSI